MQRARRGCNLSKCQRRRGGPAPAQEALAEIASPPCSFAQFASNHLHFTDDLCDRVLDCMHFYGWPPNLGRVSSTIIIICPRNVGWSPVNTRGGSHSCIWVIRPVLAKCMYFQGRGSRILQWVEFPQPPVPEKYRKKQRKKCHKSLFNPFFRLKIPFEDPFKGSLRSL